MPRKFRLTVSESQELFEAMRATMNLNQPWDIKNYSPVGEFAELVQDLLDAVPHPKDFEPVRHQDEIGLRLLRDEDLRERVADVLTEASSDLGRGDLGQAGDMIRDLLLLVLPPCRHERRFWVRAEVGEQCVQRQAAWREWPGEVHAHTGAPPRGPYLEGAGGDYLELSVCVDCRKVQGMGSASNFLDMKAQAEGGE